MLPLGAHVWVRMGGRTCVEVTAGSSGSLCGRGDSRRPPAARLRCSGGAYVAVGNQPEWVFSAPMDKGFAGVELNTAPRSIACIRNGGQGLSVPNVSLSPRFEHLFKKH